MVKQKLNINGKSSYVNTLCISLFVYPMSVLEAIPTNAVTQFYKIVKDFLWNGGRPKIALKKLTNSIEFGGLKLVDLSLKDKSLKCLGLTC